MRFDKRKELYWIAAIAMVTFVAGLVVFGSTLWNGEPVEIQIHDAYFVFAKQSILAVIFAVLLAIVYGCRAIFGHTTDTFKVVAVMVAVVVFGTLVTGVSTVYQALNGGTEKYQQPLRTKVEFSFRNYPGPDYIITLDTLAVDSFRIVLMVPHDVRTELVKGDVWIRRLVGDSITEKYIGPLETEYGAWIPDPQPIPGMFMVIQCDEYDGVVNLIGKHGAFISFPGRRYAVDQENRIYTSFAEYDTLVYEYDLMKGSGESLEGKHRLRRDLRLQGGGDTGGYWLR